MQSSTTTWVTNMLVMNDANLSKTVTTNLVLGKYLMKNGLPPLQKNGAVMIFSKTKRFEEAMAKLPVNIKLFGRVVI